MSGRGGAPEQFQLVAGGPTVDAQLSGRSYGVFIQNLTAQYVEIPGTGFMPPNTSGSFPLNGEVRARAIFNAPPSVAQPVAVAGQTAFITYSSTPLPFIAGPVQSSALASVVTLERFAHANIPAAGKPGREIQLTDWDKGVWIDDGITFGPLGGEVFNVKLYDARGDGITDDSAAIQGAITAAAAVASTGTFGARVWFPPGNYFCKSALTWPAPSIDLIGSGMFSTTLRFDGAHDGIDGIDAGPSFANGGRIRDMQIVGQNGALAGISVAFRQEIFLERLRISGFTQQAVFLNHSVMCTLDGCQIGSNGDATHAQVEVDNSTTFHWRASYISGSNGTTIAGLAIDRTGPFTILGGNIETSGIPLRMAGKADNVTGVGPGVVFGIGLENPNNGAITYVELGNGWTGTAGQGCTRVAFIGVLATPSGSATVTRGIRAVQTDTIRVEACNFSLPAVGTNVMFDLVGVTGNNLRWSIGVNGGPIAPVLYVQVNGATRSDARPDHPWDGVIGRALILDKSTFALNSATPAADGYSFFATNSTLATAITNITGGVEGQMLIIWANDANTTLNHLAGGAGQIRLQGGVNLLLTGGHKYHFVFDGVNGIWDQVGTV